MLKGPKIWLRGGEGGDSTPIFNKTQYLRLRLYDSDFNALSVLGVPSEYSMSTS